MIHNRRSLRLPGYDYSQPGAYFVTICVQHREARFGNIARDEMIIDDAGKMVYAEWQRLPARFATMELDAFVVMPNHLHAIVRIVDSTDVGEIRVEASQRAGTSPAPTDQTARPTLSDMVGAFKSITTDEYIRGVKKSGWLRFDGRLWQRNFYDHIIRDDRELNAIRQYIQNNPAKWEMDRDNPVGHNQLVQMP